MSDLVGNPEDRFSRVEAHIIKLKELLITLIDRKATTCTNDFLLKWQWRLELMTQFAISLDRYLK